MEANIGNTAIDNVGIDLSIANLTDSSLKIDNGKDHLSDNTSSTSGVSVGESNSSSAPGSPNPTLSRSDSVPPSPDDIWQEVKESPGPCHGEEGASTEEGKVTKKPKGFSKLFRRHSSSPDKAPTNPRKNSSRRTSASSNLDMVRVDCLPQVFLAKYLGHQPCDGLSGTNATRGPVEGMIDAVAKLKRGDDLPLCQLQVSTRGIIVQEHTENRGKKVSKALIPLEFISYGVQDVHFSRIFTFIVVQELSSKQRKTECHAYICDRSATTRKMALSLALAFKEYASKLKGKPHTFKVELESTKTEDNTEEPEKENKTKTELSEV